MKLAMKEPTYSAAELGDAFMTILADRGYASLLKTASLVGMGMSTGKRMDVGSLPSPSR